MKVVIAIDSFKGSMSSLEAGSAIADGIRRAYERNNNTKALPNIDICPIADGGEGTVDALVEGMRGRIMTSLVKGPLGEPTKAKWGIIDDGKAKTAVIEMAEAAGIALLTKEQLNPFETTTYGVGELIKSAITEGCRKFIIGIGGSSTNDGGVGMLQALGYDFMDGNAKPIARGAKGLKELESISGEHRLQELSECTFQVACDVKNPLCGNMGCSVVYGPQKGATAVMIEQMDAWLAHYAKLSAGDMDYPGSGAAGGMGFAFRTFLNASLEPGIDIVLEETKLEDRIKDVDIVITGEGRMDSQTIMGKAPVGVASLAKKYGKKVIAFCGCASDDAAVVNDHGIDAYFTILQGVVSLDEALEKTTAMSNLSKTAEQVFNIIM